MRHNVGHVCERLKDSPVIGKMAADGDATLICGVYNLETGAVDFID